MKKLILIIALLATTNVYADNENLKMSIVNSVKLLAKNDFKINTCNLNVVGHVRKNSMYFIVSSYAPMGVFTWEELSDIYGSALREEGETIHKGDISGYCGFNIDRN